ncbi:MAG: amino acid adenylation domain-containing protein [Gammaproteobacteria bacterium]
MPADPMTADRESTDIQAALESAPGVADCHAVLRADSGGRTQRLLYVVPARVPPAEGWAAALADRLGATASGWRIVAVTALPYSAGGEVDDAALSAVPVIDAALCERAATRAAGELGVECAAVTVPTRQRLPNLHVEALLPGALLRERTAARAPAPAGHAAVIRPDAPAAVADGGPIPGVADLPENLLDLLERAAAAGTGGVVIRDHDERETRWSYADLLGRACAGAARLRAQGLAPGTPVLLPFEEPARFLHAFWSCVAAGCVPIPSVAPNPGQPGAAQRLKRTWDSLGQVPVVAGPSMHAALRDALSGPGGAAPRIMHPGDGAGAGIAPHRAARRDIALMMLTSGSTGLPKAVPLSHHNLLCRARAEQLAKGMDAADRTLNWMPLDHVAGLTYYHLRDVLVGALQVHVPTGSVLRDPLHWLDLCEQYAISMTFAPNFGFGLVCAQADRLAGRRWDLSRLRCFDNAGEAIAARTARRFVQLLLPHRLPESAMVPAWGMSELSSAITLNFGFRLDRTSDDDPFVAVGRPIPGTRVRIVDGDDRPLPEGVEGQLQAAGETMFGGYWNASGNAPFTADGWFRTGDLGIIEAGCLSITGRDKETVIVGGVKYPGPAIESAVDGIAGVVPSFSAACAIVDPGLGIERLAVFFVPRDSSDRGLERLLQEIPRRVAAQVGVTPEILVPLAAQRIPKTSLGKIQRGRLRDGFAAGEMDAERQRAERLAAVGGSLPAWFFRRRWQVRRARAARELSSGAILVAGDDGLAASLSAALGPGREVVPVPADAEALAGAIQAGGPAAIVLALRGADPRSGARAVGALARALAARDSPVPCRVIVVPQPGLGGDPVAAALATFARAIGREIAGVDVVHVDADDPVTGCVDALHARETQVAWRDGVRRVAVLESVLPQPLAHAPLRAGGRYLVSGGAGGIGRLLVDRLLETFSAHVVVIGRRAEAALDDEARAWLARARERGSLRYAAADITDAAALDAALDALGSPWSEPADGAFHLAGLYHEARVAAEDPDRFAALVAVKAAGARVLHARVARRPEAIFVAFSSLLGEIAGAEVGAYAAANSALEAEVDALARQGAPRCWSIAWGSWREIGLMRGRDAGAALRALGILDMDSRQGWHSLLIVLGQAPGTWLVGLDAGTVAPRGTSAVPVERIVVGAVQPAESVSEFVLDDAFGSPATAEIVAVDAIARTAGGEVDASALRAALRAAGRREAVAPRDDLEARLAGLWRRVLGTDDVGVEDGFFDLGGRSLTATELLGAIERAFGARWSMRDLFATPTIAAQALRLRASAPSVEAMDAPQPRAIGSNRLPLSFAQRRLWLAERVVPGNPLWNIHARMRWHQGVDAAALGRALWRLCERHEALRTLFAEDAGDPVQVVQAEPLTTMPVVDLAALAPAQRAAAARRAADADARQRFDLQNGPLLRAQLLRLGADGDELLLAVHHLVADGWSIRIVFDELRALYAHERGERDANLPELPIQYGDYAKWQRDRVDPDASSPHLDYWLGRLAGVTTGTVLRGDRPRPPQRTGRGAILRSKLDPALTRAIDAACRREGVTPSAWLFACFAALLQRWTGESDVVAGTVVANRHLPQIQDLVGFFVNIVVLRQQVDADDSFAHLAAAAQSALLEAQEHATLPFEVLVARSGAGRDPRYSALFQVAFDVRDPRLSEGGPGLDLRVMDRDVERAQYDLHLTIEPAGEGSTAIWNYSTDIYDPSTIERLAAAFTRLAAAAAADPRVAVGRLPLVDAIERAWSLRALNATARPQPESCVHDRFLAVARQRPLAPALRFDGAEVSYRDLDDRSACIAAFLQQHGFGCGDRVGVALERGPDLVAAILGVMRCGAAWVPIDVALPDERIDFIVRDSGCRGVVAAARDASRIRDTQVLDIAAARAAQAAPVPVPVAAGDPAYLIYTSGSTGLPKGVIVEHRGLANLAEAQIEAFGIDAGSRVLQFASIGFDAAVSEIFTALCAGATLVLGTREELLPGQALVRFLARERVSVVTLVPSVLRVLPHDPLPELRTLVSAGEPLGQDLAALWAPGRRMLNAYGPTECTVCATIGTVDPDDPRPPDIGLPIANVTVHLLDASLEPVPVGVDGEICIGGAGVARGYHGREALTRERFVCDPHAGDPGARLYRSGDYGRRRADGRIEYTGRRDDQFKIRGVRVEIGEVEAAIAGLPGVAAAAATVRRQGEDLDLIGFASLAAVCGTGRAGRALQWWPSVSEFYVYDALIYHAMIRDELRNDCYRRAIGRLVPGRTVVEIGTGPEAILARMCVEAGARHVYAVELLEASWRAACATVDRLGLRDRITVLHGDATRIRLPEPAEVCVSEIVGAIGGSEGAVPILNAARQGLLAPGGAMIPGRSVTRIAAVSLPAPALENPAFADLQAGYVERIFAEVGRRFDLRVCLRGLSYEDLASSHAVLEDLDFSAAIAPACEHEIVLEIVRDDLVAGFLAWLTLETAPGIGLDTLAHEHCWLPVFLPAFDPPLPVRAGDRIEARVSRRLADNGLNPDFVIDGVVVPRTGARRAFTVACPHAARALRGNAFYGRLFDAQGRPRRVVQPDGQALRAALAQHLPEALIPMAIHVVDGIPVAASGKTDRRALLASLPTEPSPPAAPSAYGGDIESRIATIWCAVLARAGVDPDANFFDIGGHSLKAAQVNARLRDSLGMDIPLLDHFRYPTVRSLARHLADRDGVAPTVAPGERADRMAQGRARLERQRGLRGGGTRGDRR